MKKNYFLVGPLLIFLACTTAPSDNTIKNQKIKSEEVLLKPNIKDTNLDIASTSDSMEVTTTKKNSKPKVSKKTPKNDRYLIINLRDFTKEIAAKQDSSVVNRQQIPEKWLNQYDKDKKWQEMYNTSVASFLRGWENEFTEHPTSHLPKDELIFAYRKRMEKLFFEHPSFIEYSQKKFTESKELSEFLKKWEANIK